MIIESSRVEKNESRHHEFYRKAVDLDIERMVVAGEQYEPVMRMADNKKPLTTKESDVRKCLKPKWCVNL